MKIFSRPATAVSKAAELRQPPRECGGGAGWESAAARTADLALASRPDLTAVDAAAGESSLSAAALAGVWAAVEASTSANTKAAYRSDWARFTAWAAAAGHPALPADPMVVAAYLNDAAAQQDEPGEWRYSPATLTRWTSSIKQFHTAAGIPAPGRSEVVRRALSGIRRIRATPPNRRARPLLEDIRKLFVHLSDRVTDWPGGVIARRDAALLSIGFATAARRSELVGLTVGDVAEHRLDGLHLRLKTSKTDQEARGTVKAVPYGRDPATCPPCAYARSRLLLDAADQADPAGPQRRPVMAELRRQAGDGEWTATSAASTSRRRPIGARPCSRWCTRPAGSAGEA